MGKVVKVVKYINASKKKTADVIVMMNMCKSMLKKQKVFCSIVFLKKQTALRIKERSQICKTTF